MASLVVPDCLKVVGTSLDHGDKTFLIFDSFDDDEECERILIFIAWDAAKRRNRHRNITSEDLSNGVKHDCDIVHHAHRHWRRVIPNFLHDVAQRK